MCRIIQRRNRNNVLLSSKRILCVCLLKFSAFVETEAKALWVVGGRQKNRLKNFSALSKPAARNCFSPLSYFSRFPCSGKTGKQILWPPFYCLSACSTMAVWLAPAHLPPSSSSSQPSTPPSSSSESSVVPAHIWPLTLTRRVTIMLFLLKKICGWH